MKRVRSKEVIISPPNEDCVLIRWEKVGGGSFLIQNRWIKPREKFWAAREDIPDAFINSLRPLSDVPDVPEDKKPENLKIDLEFKIEPRGKGWFDVINEQGKKMNEKSLRIEDAEELLKSLKA